jgi:radical SAM protein (TIGR01212 family)
MKKIFFKDYLTEKYGMALYRVPVDLPFSCPHRISGGGKGCTFCPEDGARARHLRNNLDLKTQVNDGIAYVHRRYGKDCGLIAYFQSFTNTNAPLEELKKYYSEVLSYAKFAMVIISTRPDCLPDDVLDYLSELNEEYDLWIELGVQSANDKTLERINRQHNFQCVKDAVAKLAERKIKSVAHVILGLPGEGICEFRRTAEEISRLPFSAVKIHNLLVLKKTPMAKEYAVQQETGGSGQGVNHKNRESGTIIPMNEYEYADALLDFLKYIPDDWPLMRITADADPDDIIAPKWWMKKGQFLEYIRERLENPAKLAEKMPTVKTADGSLTLYQPEYKQHFHSLAGAESEAEKKFIVPCEIRRLLEAGKDLKILDVGFGLGYNAVAVANLANQIRKGRVDITSLEMDLRTVEAASAIAEKSPDDALRKTILKSLLTAHTWTDKFSSIKLLLGDARQTISLIDEKFDAVFHDPFSHEVNPELWSYDFFRAISAKLADDGVIATYSNAFPVRGAMIRCRLYVGETPAFGRKKGGTIASFNKAAIRLPLPEKDMNIIMKSTAGVAYRDITLNKNRRDICEFRRKVVKKLHHHKIPKWYK